MFSKSLCLRAFVLLLTLPLAPCTAHAKEGRPNLAWLGWLHLPTMTERKPGPDMDVKRMELWSLWESEPQIHLDWLPEDKNSRGKPISIFPQLTEEVLFSADHEQPAATSTARRKKGH